ncbi:excalibur calcium-binding domain-containing protein [Microvirga roseola]|uniref:excalibur calcium-binding domain-containing protein n=1 Tax=Microvirga roseola TaxID=2883126 RepID=UPI001E3BD9E0|nr:excalibur calcium-binding domain-containing protein [Microvirga roseola]
MQPENWRFYESRAPDRELQSLQRRFRAISCRFYRKAALQRLCRRVRVWALVAVGVLALTGTAMSVSPWPLLATVKHLAAFPTCGIARMMGVAPAYHGRPGYWSHHDRNSNGRACETQEL